MELFEDSVPADGGVGEDGRGQRGGEQGRRGAVPAVAGGWGLQGVDAGDDAMVEVAQGRRVRAGGGGEPEVALGIVGLELGLAIAASIWLQRRLGYRRWHVLHYLAYVAFALSLAHVIATSREVQALGMLGLAVFALAAACAPMALLRVLPATTAVATRITPPGAVTHERAADLDHRAMPPVARQGKPKGGRGLDGVRRRRQVGQRQHPGPVGHLAGADQQVVRVELVDRQQGDHEQVPPVRRVDELLEPVELLLGEQLDVVHEPLGCALGLLEQVAKPVAAVPRGIRRCGQQLGEHGADGVRRRRSHLSPPSADGSSHRFMGVSARPARVIDAQPRRAGRKRSGPVPVLPL
ncbi:ferric reductase-like transmembrane domain-containing protein [Frankia sp. CiP3]|uniref:ferric reductase-like transmembrane domain-containing protein n=1 Tax=Frankia sp. CiP3 TaxID=2880971 RepID=UPI001EF407B8|nr:ferric reductase-like transmembrane domain-containing protein [Frankia sp. CiP3]